MEVAKRRRWHHVEGIIAASSKKSDPDFSAQSGSVQR